MNVRGKGVKTIKKTSNIFDLDDYYILKQNGWDLPSNITLEHYKKVDLISIIRCLEHNWVGNIKKFELQCKRLENFYNYYKEKGNEELFNDIIGGDINE